MMKADESISLFGDILNPKFFGLLSGTNKVQNFILVNFIDDYFGDSVAAIKKEELTKKLDDFIISHNITSVGDDVADKEAFAFNGIPENKASLFIRDLVDRGWLEEEFDGFTAYDRRSDGFVKIVEALNSLITDETNTQEYSTPIINIYQVLMAHDFTNPVETLEGIDSNRKKIISDLESIDSKIRRFINRAMKDDKQTDQEILDTLVIKYSAQPYYRALTRLLGEANPAKFHTKVNSVINNILDNELDTFVMPYIERKFGNNLSDERYVEAKKESIEIIEGIFLKTKDLFDELGSDVDMISRRNTQYVGSSKSRLMFRLNYEKNISGDIASVLRKMKEKNVKDDIEYSDLFGMAYFEQVDADSLMKPRKMAEKAPSEVEIQVRKLNEKLLERAKKLSEYQNKFSNESIMRFIEERIKEKREVSASEFDISDIDDVIKTMMVPIFLSMKTNKRYEVEKKVPNRFKIFGFDMPDYVIRREIK